jgi:hypothetical protein
MKDHVWHVLSLNIMYINLRKQKTVDIFSLTSVYTQNDYLREKKMMICYGKEKINDLLSIYWCTLKKRSTAEPFLVLSDSQQTMKGSVDEILNHKRFSFRWFWTEKVLSNHTEPSRVLSKNAELQKVLSSVMQNQSGSVESGKTCNGSVEKILNIKLTEPSRVLCWKIRILEHSFFDHINWKRFDPIIRNPQEFGLKILNHIEFCQRLLYVKKVLSKSTEPFKVTSYTIEW